ncbi:hypothetical protein PS691_02649 [Pseudomonas fluorescens]|uniref:Uncharacterized protein n=1 Tax=Pseudomonas fluorescens TaxID=294 RepID=A0A5E7CFS2_PSEFL|nr:hypothetical protein PS691_02649 [Pseudomonas fluorescens]
MKPVRDDIDTTSLCDYKFVTLAPESISDRWSVYW